MSRKKTELQLKQKQKTLEKITKTNYRHRETDFESVFLQAIDVKALVQQTLSFDEQ